MTNSANAKITRKNPAGMHHPVGNYSHITRIPRNAELFVCSGQIGADLDGRLPESLNEQVANTFRNIQTALQSEGLSPREIIKVNIWSVEPIDWPFLNEEWAKLFGSEFPAMTIAYISELGLPEIKIEIEIWAAKV